VAAAKTARNNQIIAAYATGARSLQSIADEHGITRQTAGEIIQRWRIAQGPVDKAEEIARATDLLDRLIEAAADLAEREGTPVTAGKDGFCVVDPTQKGPQGEDVYVRDYGNRLAAIDRVRTLLERKAKLLGLDSATKTEVSGSVEYSIPGLDPKTLQ
jgi:hypothetical protein